MGFPGGTRIGIGRLSAVCLLALPALLHAGEAAPEPSVKTPGPPEKSSEPPTRPKPPPAGGLAGLSLEELMNIQVTSVSKAPEKVTEAAAAIHVITGDDIRRSGATSIAEALRMAPGVQVGRLNAHRWAVSARGFNSEFANKLLVLMDGRSIYTPLFSGTFWDVQDTLLEDIDRIEVIRGPGATLWGANAVNGVINIITKSAKETQGGLAVAGAGTEEAGFGGVRYGGKPSKNIAIRGYAKYFDRDDQALPGGDSASDEWRMARGGFRMDWDASQDDALTFQGDIYSGEAGDRVPAPSLTPPFTRNITEDGGLSGGNLLGRWSHKFSDTSRSELQLYYDRTNRKRVAIIDETRDTLDLDFQHQFALGTRQNVVCGAGYRVSRDRTESGPLGSFDPRGRTIDLVSAFVQDEIVLLKNKLHLTLGSKFEYNDFTYLEIQPSSRLLWTPHARHTVWASVSRAVRTPSRSDSDVRADVASLPPGTLAPGTPAALVSILGNRGLKSEELLSYELGYRVRPHSRLSLDFAGFANRYNNLTTLEAGPPPFLETSPAPPHLVLGSVIGNKKEGETYGGEAVAIWQAKKWWRVSAAYSFLEIQLHKSRGTTDRNAEKAEGDSPRNQFVLRSSMDLPHNVELDFAIRYVDSLARSNVPAYVTGDVRVGWRPSKKLELSIVGQNLFDNQHPEFGPTIPVQTTEIERSAYFKATLRF